MTQLDLEALFSQIGNIITSRILYDQTTGTPKRRRTVKEIVYCGASVFVPRIFGIGNHHKIKL